MISLAKQKKMMSDCIAADTARIKDQIKSMECNAARGYDISSLTNTLKILNRQRNERKDVNWELYSRNSEEEYTRDEADDLQYPVNCAVARLKDAELMGFDIDALIDEIASLASQLKVKREILAYLF